MYSLSFEQNPNWSRRYATSWKIQEYLIGVVDKHELRERMRLNTAIVEARFDEAWAGGAVACKGMSVAGFPNWVSMMGPNTGPGHTSVLAYTKAQISHAVQATKKLMAENLKNIDIRQDVLDRYNASIQKRIKHMVWGGCKSWYLNEDGSNHSLYPGFGAEYVLQTRRLRSKD